MGKIHAWDLRSAATPWQLTVPPELGCITAVALGDTTICCMRYRHAVVLLSCGMLAETRA